MPKIRPITVFIIDIALLAASYLCFKFPHGDEYLVLFMISPLYLLVPFALNPYRFIVLSSINLAFFIFYVFLGVLNAVDILALTIFMTAAAGGSFLIKYLYESFALHNKNSLDGKKEEYNGVISSLENVDTEGARVEDELARVTRLYEVTKKLASSLKFDDLLDALFGFIEENFKIQVMHLLVFKDEEYARTISRDIIETDYGTSSGETINSREIVSYAKSKNMRAFYIDRKTGAKLLDSMNVRHQSFMAFPLLVGDKLCAVLAIEGASKASYPRFNILIPQIALEFKKVELYERVQELSIIDGLTGVYLRRYLMTRLTEEAERSSRLKLTFSIGMVDVDHFKECNDKYGHLVGDVVLRRIAEKLKDSVREVDMVARYGGEEFCVVLPETEKGLAIAVAERLREAVEADRIKAYDEEIRATVSVGIATYPEDGGSVKALIERADTALYKAKGRGRNRVCVV